MSAVIPSNRGGRCTICWKDFEEGERKVTHVGGEGHDPLHYECLKSWIANNPICPYDQMPIDTSSLLSRSERIYSRFNNPANLRVLESFAIGAAGVAAGIAAGIAATAAGVAAEVAEGVGAGVAIGVAVGVQEGLRAGAAEGAAVGVAIAAAAVVGAGVAMRASVAVAVAAAVRGARLL